MDQSLLIKKGLHPQLVGSAILSDYRIHIGDRATLLPSVSSRVFGIVMTLSDDDVLKLYSDESVHEYQPHPVRVELLNTREVVEAECYNLPAERGSQGANPNYARQLARLAESLCFDAAYVQEVASFGEHG